MVIDEYFSDLKEGQNEQRGIKSTSAFLSALGEPKQTFDGKDLYPDVLHKTAALLRSLIKNHPFHNGNKRTAVMSAIIFLEAHGYELVVPDKKLLKLAYEIVNSKPTISINRIVRWLKKYTRKTEIKQPARFKVLQSKIFNWLKQQVDSGKNPFDM